MRRQLTLKDPFLAGADVKEVQRALGFKGKAVDGDYGPDTASAVEEWKWRVGYPKRQINNRLGLLGIAWLFGEVPFPGHFARNSKAAEGEAVRVRERHRPPAVVLAGVQQRVLSRRRRGSARPERCQAPRRQGLVRPGTEPGPGARGREDHPGARAADDHRPGLRRLREDRIGSREAGLGLPPLRPGQDPRGTEGAGRTGRRACDAVARRRAARAHRGLEEQGRGLQVRVHGRSR